MKQASKHPRRWRIALFVGIPLLVLAIATFTLMFVASHSASDKELSVEPKEIPSSWIVPSSSAQTGSVVGTDADEVLLTDQLASPVERTMSGALIIIGNGKQFGEESYELQISNDNGVHMTSRGTFSFKVILAKVTAAFSQDVSLDGELRPDRYTLEINGPLGIGNRRIEGVVVGNVARLTSDDKQDEIHIGTSHPLVLGTFSTYTLIPVLFSLLEGKGTVEFQVIPLMRGRGKEDDAGKTNQPILLSVTRAGDALIKTGTGEVVVDKYILASSIGNSTLLAKDDEFLALVASSGDGSLIAYRSDYFPDGIILP